MGLGHIKAEIEHMRVQIKRQQKDINSLQKAGISDKVDALCQERDRLSGEERLKQRSYASGKTIRGDRQY